MIFFQIIPYVNTEEETRDRTAMGHSSPRVRDFPTTIISDPIFAHFSQDQHQTCTHPLKSLRSSIETVPQHIVRKIRRQFSRSRSGSDSASSASNSTGHQTDLILQSPGSGSTVSEPNSEEQYLHLGISPT
jgi:hypothetical protein